MPAPILTADKMLTDVQIRDLCATHGRIAHLMMLRAFKLRTQLYPLEDNETPAAAPKSAFFEIVLRPATPAELRVYKQRARTAAAASADDELLKQMTVYPESPEVLAAIMKDWAGLSAGAAKTIMRMSGAALEEEGKY